MAGSQNGRKRILSICRQKVAEMEQSVRLMKGGKMGTSGLKNGRIVSTTQETIIQHEEWIAALRATIARIEAMDA